MFFRIRSLSCIAQRGFTISLQVFRLLDDARQGREVDLPNVQSILPFLGLYSLVILQPTELDGLRLLSHHLPALSVLQDDQFVLAPPDTEPDVPGTARIFDALAMIDKTDIALVPAAAAAVASYQIPLSPHDAEFAHRRYWRVPAKPGVMLMMLLERIRHLTSSACEEVNHARVIWGILMINKAGVEVSRRLDEGGESRRRKADDEHSSDEPPRKTRRKKEKGSKAEGSSSTTTTTKRPSAGPGPARRKTVIVRL